MISQVIGPRMVRLRFIGSGRRTGPSLLIVGRIASYDGTPSPPWRGSARVDLRAEGANVRELTIALGVVQAVPDDEHARDVEAHVLDRHLDLSGLRLAQQGEHLD